MIPLRDNITTLRFAYVTYALIIINAMVFFYELSLGQRGYVDFISTWGYVPDLVTGTVQSGAFDPRILATLVTSVFLHGGWVHIGGNMLYLHIFGNNVEDAMGRARFVFFYLLIGVAANFAQVVVSPHSLVPGIGASGAIAGVLGAYALLYPRAGVLVLIPIFFFIRIITLPALAVLLFWFVIQVFQGSLTLAAGQAGAGGVAFWVHAAGFVLGAALIWVFRNSELTGAKPTWI
ncbi:MAG TPA: rhomboid family intramembrane serine protease [Thermoleophilia bacterium]|nr:rhomboid family intramembrane serine protease [Thermoleophilia bacterium]